MATAVDLMEPLTILHSYKNEQCGAEWREL